MTTPIGIKLSRLWLRKAVIGEQSLIMILCLTHLCFALSLNSKLPLPPSPNDDKNNNIHIQNSQLHHQTKQYLISTGLAIVTGLKYPSRTAIAMLTELYTPYSEQFSLQA